MWLHLKITGLLIETTVKTKGWSRSVKFWNIFSK